MTDEDYGTQPFRRRVKRPGPWLTLGPDGPLHAAVTVTRMNYEGYPEPRHEIRLKWIGPKMSGTPNLTNPQGITHASDIYIVEDPELARLVAVDAHVAANTGRIIPLKSASERLQQRAARPG